MKAASMIRVGGLDVDMFFELKKKVVSIFDYVNCIGV